MGQIMGLKKKGGLDHLRNNYNYRCSMIYISEYNAYLLLKFLNRIFSHITHTSGVFTIQSPALRWKSESR